MFAKALAALSLLVCAAAPAVAVEPDDLAVGQVWTIQDAPWPEARALIGAMEDVQGMAVVHISLSGLGGEALGAGGTIGHLTYEPVALSDSLGELVDEGVEPEPMFFAGIDQWRGAQGGAWNIPVTHAVTVMFSSILYGDAPLEDEGAEIESDAL